MSTSISLTISSESNEIEVPKTGRSDNQRKSHIAEHRHRTRHLNVMPNSPPLFDRRHTGSGPASAGELFLDLDAARLRRWRQHARGESLSDSNSHNETKVGDFYEEVDERMSRNSLEYPDQQARYIDRWLAQSDARRESSPRSKSFDDDSARINGNVIGIRGFSSGSYMGESRRIRENYVKLKREHASLRTDYGKLKSHFEQVARSYGRTWKRKQCNLDLLQAPVVKQDKRLKNPSGPHEEEPEYVCDTCGQRDGLMPDVRTPNEEDWRQIKELELRLASREQEYANNLGRMRADKEQLELELAEKNHELDNLKNELRQMSLESQSRKLVQLQQDNSRMKESSERERSEYQRLKVNYDLLETQLRSLVKDQKLLGDEQNVELSRALVELCRLQVYQPKLEMTLETERKIKLELEMQIKRLQSDKTELNERVVALERELHQEKMQRKSLETDEIERTRAELLSWQERHQMLREERNDLQESLRRSRMKLAEADAKMSALVDSVRDSCRAELEQAAENIKRLESERQRLVTRLDGVSDRLARCEIDRDNANRELVKLHHELAVATNDRQQARPALVDTVTNQLQQCESKCLSLEKRSKSLEAKNHELQAELKLVRGKEVYLKQQLNEQKHRFALQQKAFDEFRQRKEKEVAKLRVDLNYERYNRQISLRGIEKELRSSLRELESMECRFSKRPGVRNHESVCDTTLASGRSVQFDDETPEVRTTSTAAAAPPPPTMTMADDTRPQQRIEASCCSKRNHEKQSEEQEAQSLERRCADDHPRQCELAE